MPPASEIGAIVVHGMGTQPEQFANAFIARMDRRLEMHDVPAGTVRWKPVWWADLVRDREEQLWAAVSRDHTLRFSGLRRFFITHFGDALAYQRVPVQRSDFYRDIHTRVADRLRDLRAELAADAPLVVIAHSLGSVIMSNFIWDVQRGNDERRDLPAATPFERMETLTALVTLGSSIALFTLRLAEIVAIEFPPPALPPHLRQVAQWLNFYDADDVLAYPLRPLSPTYEAAVTEDVAIDAGHAPRSWTPLSHDAYWTDDESVGRTARLMRDVALAARGA
ncbi:MAG TPA: hypothetical protein VJ812_07890 [Gemmatimonadaceae bacterium]|nr:hypothetical protein [Gemmatimonadaceae bacterium]